MFDIDHIWQLVLAAKPGPFFARIVEIRLHTAVTELAHLIFDIKTSIISGSWCEDPYPRQLAELRLMRYTADDGSRQRTMNPGNLEAADDC